MGQPIIDLLGPGALGLLAGVLAFAGLSKASSTRDLRWTLQQLGVGEGLSRPVAVVVVVAELVAAAGLLVSPTRAWPRLLVVALGFAFAAAGVKALTVEERIGCTCFGNVRQGFLGWRQIVLLPCWLLLVALVWWRPPTWSASRGLLALAVLVLAVAYWQVLRGLPAWRELRDARLALDQDRGLVMTDIPAAEGKGRR